MWSVISNSLQLRDCSPPGSSVHEILQARILGWVTTCSSTGSSHSGIKPMSLVSLALAGRFFMTAPPGEPISVCARIYAYIFSFRFFPIIFNSLCLFLCIRYISYIS